MKEQKNKGKQQDFVVSFGKTNTTGYCYDEEMILHKNHKEFHVERPERIMALYFRLTETNLIDKLTKIEVKEITEENILVHSKLYLNKINDLVNRRHKGEVLPLEKGENTFSFNSTYENKWTPYCARLAAGGVIEVIDAVYSNLI